MKTRWLVAIILLLILWAGNLWAVSLFSVSNKSNIGNFTFEVTNTTPNVCYFGIYWIDHPFQGLQGEPAVIAGGELYPGEVLETKDSFPPGIYGIVMYNIKTEEQKSGLFKFIDGTGKVLITWESVTPLRRASLDKRYIEAGRVFKYDSNAEY